MRLIDADSLRKQIDDCKYFDSSFQKMTVAEFLTIVYDLIDNAPTIVVTTKLQFKERNNENGKLQRRKG